MLKIIKHKFDETIEIFSHKTFTFISLLMAVYSLSKALRITVMGWYIYDVTRDPVHLGFIALAEALPYILTNPFGGYLADRYGRVRQSYILIVLSFFLTALLTYVVYLPYQQNTLLWIYILFVLFGFFRGLFASGALPTLLALSISREKYQKVTAWNGSIIQMGIVLGPVIGGIFYLHQGVVVANAIVLLFMVICFVFLFQIKDKPVEKSENMQSEWHKLTLGFRYIFNHATLRSTVMLDFTAVVFTGVTGLLPVFARDILHLGPDGLGYLRAAIQLGSIAAGLFLANRHLKNYIGKQYMIAVFLFCMSLLAFSFSTSFYLSLLLLFASGFFDWYGAVIRQTIMRLLTPENILGRVTSARTLFAVSGNEVSTFESGLVAGAIGTIPSVVFGAIVTLLATAYVWRKVPSVKDINMEGLLQEQR